MSRSKALLIASAARLLVAWIALASVAGPAAAQAIHWSTRAPMPTPRVYFGTAVVGGRIYAIGGYSGSTLATVEAYDPATDQWTSRASMPTPRAHFVVAAVGGKIYAIGGYQLGVFGTATTLYATEEYDPATNTWTTKTELPHDPPLGYRNSYIGGAAAGGKIYVTVFNVATPGLTATYEYDPVADAWTTNKAPVPFPYTRYASTSLNGKVYVLDAGEAPYSGPFTTGDRKSVV